MLASSVLAPPTGTLSHSPLAPAAAGLPDLTPENTVFAAVSFEGPDAYANAGGLGVRITELTRALAARGFETHLYFIGDPELPGEERVHGLPLTYHRWGQWISRSHPRGVYDGEWGKIADMRASLPQHMVRERVRPAAREGKRVVILSEEWHTAGVASDISDALWSAGLRGSAVMLWNANNTLGFEHVDFRRLAHTQSLSAVSRFMKQELWSWGCNPLVIPNGIPERLLEPSPLVDELSRMAQSHLKDRCTVGKVARFDPDKRWLMAVDAVAGLKEKGLPVLFLARGGVEAHGQDVLALARERGLRIREARSDSRDPSALMLALMAAAEEADMVDIRFHLSDPLKRALFGVADAMLQNSGREPFGLVGLEVMAAGGLVFTGATGEEYARSWDNAVVLDTDDPREIEATLLDLLSRPGEMERMRRRGTETAREYTWSHAVDQLLRRLRYLAG